MHRALVLACALAMAVIGGPTVQAQAPRTISIAIGADPDRLYRPQTPTGRLAAQLVFDPLIGLDDTMTPYPVLAAAVPSLDNGLVTVTGSAADRRLVVTMPLRPDVTWSDGVPFTADDVIYTWKLMMNPLAGFTTPVEDKIRSVDKLDDLTVRFTYLSGSEARTQFPDRFAQQGNEPVMDPLAPFGLYDAVAIYPQHVLRDLVGDDPRHSSRVAALATSDFASAPIGTGPFVLTAWAPGDALTFTSRGQALPQRLAAPGADSIVMRVFPNPGDALTALALGNVQVIAQGSLEPSDTAVLDATPGVQTYDTPGAAWEHLTFNLDNPTLSEPRVRQAIGSAVDRAALNTAALNGKGQVATSQVPTWSWAFDPAAPTVTYDPGRARALLEAAGWTPGADGIRVRKGQRLSLKLWTTPAPYRQTLTGLIHDQLAAVGIDVRIDTFPRDTLFDPVGSAPQALVNRAFDIAEFAWVSGYDPGTDARFTMQSGAVPSPANGFRGSNYGTYKNPRVDQLLDQLQVSQDPNFRRAALHEAQAIWQSDLPVLPLVLRPVITAASTRVSGYRPTPAPAGETWNIEQWTLTVP